MSVAKASPCTSSPKQLPTSDVQKSGRHEHASSRCIERSESSSRTIGHSASGNARRPGRWVGTRRENDAQSSSSSKGSASSVAASRPSEKTGRQPW